MIMNRVVMVQKLSNWHGILDYECEKKAESLMIREVQ